jgi:hypothetical protein
LTTQDPLRNPVLVQLQNNESRGSARSAGRGLKWKSPVDMNRQLTLRVLLVTLAVALGMIAALVAGIVTRVGGGSTANAIRAGAVTLGVTITVITLLLTFVFA